MVRALPSSSSHFLFSPSLPSSSRHSSSTSFSFHRINRPPTVSSGSGTGFVRCEAAPSAATRSSRSCFRASPWLANRSLRCFRDPTSSTSLAVKAQSTSKAKIRRSSMLSPTSCCNCLRSSGRTGIIASEEEDVPVAVEETYSGNYIVVFDPIDGSANIDTSLTTGSIFGIYGPDKQCLIDINDDSSLDQEKQNCVVSVCQPGRNLLAAVYCLYSSSVVFTLSLGKRVFGFTLDPSYGEFVLTHENIQIPKTGKIYSFNEGNYDLWDKKLMKYLDHLRQPGANGKPYSGRYIGCLVGEIHRMLLYGGIYGNPKNKNSKNGNLRLLYECAPMSYLVEQAGGKAIDGHRRILGIEPHEIHQRTPIFIGSADEVEKLEKYLA
nr:fructose-1,6-bisphosphatase 1, chloroplastic-like [Ziziphus jujuba var. spinosa]